MLSFGVLYCIVSCCFERNVMCDLVGMYSDIVWYVVLCLVQDMKIRIIKIVITIITMIKMTYQNDNKCNI